MSDTSQLSGYMYRFEPGKDPHGGMETAGVKQQDQDGGTAGPVLLLLHGTGGNEDDLIPLARLVAPEAPIVSPRGNVLENGMPRFFRRLAEGVFDLEDLAARSAQLVEFIRVAGERHAFGPERIVALGFSNGANIAASVMLREPMVLRRGILLRAMVPFEPEPRPDLRHSAALLCAGKADPIVPPKNTERLAEMMRAAGAAVDLRWQDAGHTLVQGDVTAAREFLVA